MTPPHRPRTIQQRQGEDKHGEPIGQWRTSCECGWASDWDDRHWRVHVQLRDHFESVRVPR